jgi:hypothetical protein
MRHKGKLKVVDGISCYIAPVKGDFLVAEIPNSYHSDFGQTDTDRLDNAVHIMTCWNFHTDLVDLARNVQRGVDIDIGSVRRLLEEISE